MEGVELLKQMKDIIPKTRKIMVKGYPLMQNAGSCLKQECGYIFD
jgi:hypothetical protein